MHKFPIWAPKEILPSQEPFRAFTARRILRSQTATFAVWRNHQNGFSAVVGVNTVKWISKKLLKSFVLAWSTCTREIEIKIFFWSRFFGKQTFTWLGLVVLMFIKPCVVYAWLMWIYFTYERVQVQWFKSNLFVLIALATERASLNMGISFYEFNHIL